MQLTCLCVAWTSSKTTVEEQKHAMYVPCCDHSLNLIGRSAVDSCPEAVRFFFIVQLVCTFLSVPNDRWNILKGCLGDEEVLKSLSNARWEAHADAIEAILMSYPQIIEALEYLQEAYSHAEFHSVMLKDNIVCAFPNVEISLRMFLTQAT